MGGVRSAEAVREVFRLSDAGHSRAEIARCVGVARSTVRRWLDAGPSELLASRLRMSHRELIDGLDEPAYAVRGANGLSYAYTRYQFSNRSNDIKRLFVEACDRLGIEARRMNAVTISVATRRSVALLDAFIGPKR
jgi:Homeodomain-like domain